jgi:hypothetical protein
MSSENTAIWIVLSALCSSFVTIVISQIIRRNEPIHVLHHYVDDFDDDEGDEDDDPEPDENLQVKRAKNAHWN